MSYLKDPARIYAASFAAIRCEVDLSAFPGNLHTVILRLVHAAAMPDLTDDLAYSGDAPGAAREALGAGAAILIDATIVQCEPCWCRPWCVYWAASTGGHRP